MPFRVSDVILGISASNMRTASRDRSSVFHTDANGPGHAFREIRIVNHVDLTIGYFRLDPVGHVPRDENGLRQIRILRGFHGMPDKRLAIQFGKELVGTAHAARFAGCQNDGADFGFVRHGPDLAWLWPRSYLHQKPADAHARNVMGTDIKSGKLAVEHPVKAVFPLGLRAQPGAPMTGRPP